MLRLGSTSLLVALALSVAGCHVPSVRKCLTVEEVRVGQQLTEDLHTIARASAPAIPVAYCSVTAGPTAGQWTEYWLVRDSVSFPLASEDWLFTRSGTAITKSQLCSTYSDDLTENETPPKLYKLIATVTEESCGE